MSEYQVPPETRLGPVQLIVPDIGRSMRFYGGVLGLSTLKHEDDQISISADGSTPLLVLQGRADAKPRPPRTTGLYHYALLLPSRAHLARTLAHLAEVRYPLQGASDHAVSEALYLADPDGNGIEIYADRPRGSWPYRDGELAMGTDPLDVEGLMAESEEPGLPWEGLPAGTVMGHIHLQVSDLDEADRFYRGLLGFETQARYGHSALFLSAGKYHHHIGMNIWAGRGAPQPPPGSVGLDHFTVILPSPADLAAMAERVREGGVPAEEREGGVLLRDPSGNGVLVVSG